MNRELANQVVAKLGLDGRPPGTLDGLSSLYRAWCENVPFDNVRKLIHLRSGEGGPLPGDDTEDFFTAWLQHGCGGTCWAGNGALHDLLRELGFDARRAVATMVAAPDLPPNHGSVVVEIDGTDYIVDASILHGTPLPMIVGQESTIDHPAWGVLGHWQDGAYSVRWRNFVTGGAGMECVFNSFGASRNEFAERHERTREWSPFNFGLTVNLVRGGARIGASWGRLYLMDSADEPAARDCDDDGRRRFLVEEVGMSQAIAEKLPADLPFTPPPATDG